MSKLRSIYSELLGLYSSLERVTGAFKGAAILDLLSSIASGDLDLAVKKEDLVVPKNIDKDFHSLNQSYNLLCNQIFKDCIKYR